MFSAVSSSHLLPFSLEFAENRHTNQNQHSDPGSQEIRAVTRRRFRCFRIGRYAGAAECGQHQQQGNHHFSFFISNQPFLSFWGVTLGGRFPALVPSVQRIPPARHPAGISLHWPDCSGRTGAPGFAVVPAWGQAAGSLLAVPLKAFLYQEEVMGVCLAAGLPRRPEQ